MAPTLAPGDWALVVTPSRFAVGDVVVVEHPQRPSDEPAYEMVKRLVGGPGDRIAGRELGENEFWVEGDMASASTDSRHFGPVALEGLKARVLLVYWPKHRRHVVGRSRRRLPKSRP
jgi:hypothetical protein